MADIRSQPEQDGWAEGTIKTVLLGDFYEQPTFGGLAVRATISAVPYLDQVADVQDTAAWVLLCRDEGFDELGVKISGLMLGIGWVPTVGSLGKGMLKAVNSTSGAKALLRLLDNLDFLGKGHGVKWLKKFSDDLPGLAKKAAKLMQDVLDELADLLRKLKEYVPDRVVRKIDGWIVSVKKIRNSIDEMFTEAAEHLKKKLDDALGQFRKQDLDIPTETKTSVKRVQSSTPPPGTRRAAKSIVRTDIRKPTQEMLDAGPNRWVDLPNRPDGAHDFQRGLSGDYAVGTGGRKEAESLLSGTSDSTNRYVSVLGDRDSTRTMDTITRQYANPMAIRGKADLYDVAGNMGSVKNMNIDKVGSIGAFTPPGSGDALNWGRNYLGMADDLAKEGLVPAAGSRGAAFVDKLKDAFSTAKYGEFDGFGRPLLNADEVQDAVWGVMEKWK